MAGRFVLADKEGPARERRRQSALARSGGDVLASVAYELAREALREL